MSEEKPRLRIKENWGEAGKPGVRIGPDVKLGGMWWTPVLWDGEEDPNWHRSRELEEERATWNPLTK